ncbi:MAG: sulfatase [Gemmataceae bacterium]
MRIAMFALLSVSWTASGAFSDEPKWKFKDCNLVFVSFDALQAAHVGCLGYGRNVTPTIDAMARVGSHFNRTYSVASWTVPASMTWFTGVYPSEHRMTNKYVQFAPPRIKVANLKEVAPNLRTLAQVLKSRGYATGGFTGNAGVSGGFGYEEGFDVYWHEKGKFGLLDQSVPKALAWLKDHSKEKFFLFLHGYDIHGQSVLPTGYDFRFVDKNYDKRFLGSEREQEVLREEGLANGKLTLRDEDVRFWRAIYDEKIQRADAKFKEFLGAFEKLGVADRTLFVLTSDHGTELYEHRRIDHGFTLYSELTRVPLIMKLPQGGPLGIDIDQAVSSIDVMPTILDFLDVPIDSVLAKQLRGVSMAAAAKGERKVRDIISETDYREYTYKRSILAPDGWKLICTLESRSRELYDLSSDPGESKDLAKAESARADALERRLFQHYKNIGHDLTARRWEIGLNPVYPSQGTKK